DSSVVQWLVRRHLVLVLPGSASGGSGHVRVSIGGLKEEENCEVAAGRLKEGLEELVSHGMVSQDEINVNFSARYNEDFQVVDQRCGDSTSSDSASDSGRKIGISEEHIPVVNWRNRAPRIVEKVRH
ncbi:hypothetical protein EJ110_NYTH36726, partial [Nymphaea thermarum]